MLRVVPLGLLLLYLARVTLAGILPLVGGQRRGARRRCAIPMVPAPMVLFPRRPPVLTPARRRVGRPGMEVGRRSPVVAHRHAQDVQGHELRGDQHPWAVVPGALVPVVVDEDPVQAVVEEEVGSEPRRVIHRVAGHRHQSRIGRHVDADTDPDAHLRERRRHSHAERQAERGKEAADRLHRVLR